VTNSRLAVFGMCRLVSSSLQFKAQYPGDPVIGLAGLKAGRFIIGRMQENSVVMPGR
jgi:hypothetical protein